MSSTKNSKLKLAVVLPSRGLIFSQTAEELLKELKGLDYKIYFSHNNPLPGAFNLPTEDALLDSEVTHILYCEEDMMIPKGILKKMIQRDYPVVALDYPFTNDDEATVLRDPNGMAFYSGTGFLLVMRIVLDKLPKPIWRIDKAWDTLIKRDGTIVFWPRTLGTEKTYGLHDVNFGLTLYSNQLATMVMEETAGQRKLVKRGEVSTNKGQHEIREITKVLKNNITKNTNPEHRAKFLKAVDTITGVQIRQEIPETVEYRDGQAHMKEGEYEII